MGRKSNARNSASSAAAAANATVPAFTSFAAATAHALRNYPDNSSTTTPAVAIPTQWDTAALQLLKKLSKRDATTRTRALTELDACIHSVTLDEPGLGSAFVAAWDPVFRSVVQDDTSAVVRAAALSLMSAAVSKFRRLIVPILPHVLPVWIAAQGDISTTVSEAAVKSLNEALPSPAQQTKLVTLYASELRAYCDRNLTRLAEASNPDTFLSDSRRTIAVLRWLLETTKSLDSLVNIIDANSNSLLLLARGPKQKKKDTATQPVSSAMQDVCQLAIRILPYMHIDVPSDEARAVRFANLALLGIRNRESVAWDLVLVLLRDGWHSAFPDKFEKLAQTVSRAVTAPIPTGLSVLLPLFHSLPQRNPASASFSASILTQLRSILYRSRVEKSTDNHHQGTPLSLSYIFSALPAYIECVSFAMTTGPKRWLDGDEAEATFGKAMFEEHFSPTLQRYLSGILPPVSKHLTTISINERRRSAGQPNPRFWADPAMALSSAVRHMTEERASGVLPQAANYVISGISDGGSSDVVGRLEVFFDGLADIPASTIFAKSVIQAAVNAPDDGLDKSLSAVSLIFTKEASCNIIWDHVQDQQADRDFMEMIVSYIEDILTRNAGLLDVNHPLEIVQNLGICYSWVYWACLVAQVPEFWVKILTALQSCCSINEQYCILNETIRAHKLRREQGTFSHWTAMHGNDLECSIIRAASDLFESNKSSNSIPLLTTALDASGGAAVSTDVLSQTCRAVISALTRDITFDEIDHLILVLLRSPRLYLVKDGSAILLAASSIFRAVRNKSILQAIVAFLDGLNVSDKVKAAESALDLVRNKIREAGEFVEESEVSSLAAALSQFVNVVGDSDTAASAKLSSVLLEEWVTSPFMTEYLSSTSLAYIFGPSEEDNSLNFHQIFEVYDKVDQLSASEIDVSVLHEFLRDLSVEEKTILAGIAFSRLLAGKRLSTPHVLRIICEVPSNLSSTWPPFKEIARKVSAVLVNNCPDGEQALNLLPFAMVTLVTESQRECLGNLQEPLNEVLKMVRRDPFSCKGKLGIDVLSASLSCPSINDEVKGLAPSPKWLLEYTLVALRSIRRSLEQSHSKSTSAIHELEMHGSTLMSRALSTYSVNEVAEDNVRFWLLRVHDTLYSFINKAAKGATFSEASCRRISCISELAAMLVGGIDSALSAHIDTLDAICHHGAWTGALILPITDRPEPDDSNDTLGMIANNSAGSCQLIMKAAERSVLLSREGRIPIDKKKVYNLVPLLSSRLPLTRKAVLVLLSYTAAVDLPGVVQNAFPENGFSDEAEEIRVVTNLIPEPIRAGLVWRTHGEQNAEKELAYFLTWRLFLDLVRPDDTVGKSALLGDVAEDVSFRRVGICYLRANPELYADFFAKCVEVVVDGNSSERAAAGIAAAEALEVEERAAQGIQLAQQQEGKQGHDSEGKDTPQDVQSMDWELGSAAGIAFSRALQRLPALSRQLVMDSFDRGAVSRVESFVRKRISPLLIAAEIRKVKEWGAFGGGSSSGASSKADADLDVDGELHARGSVAGREVWATYTFSDVTLEIGMRLPDVFPLQIVEVEARSRIGMSEASWRRTLLGMTTLLRAKDGTLAEAVELWRRNLDKTFEGSEECPICYSVLHLSTAALPKMQCRTCKKLFHSECLCKWFTKSNSSACPLCRSAF